MGIWRNIGKIVILLFQIGHEQVKWYIGTWSRVKRISPSSELNNIQHSGVGSNYEPLSEEEESRQRSNLMVELCEQPHLPFSDREIK